MTGDGIRFVIVMMVVMGLAGGRHYFALERYAVASAHDRKVMRDGDFDAAKAQVQVTGQSEIGLHILRMVSIVG